MSQDVENLHSEVAVVAVATIVCSAYAVFFNVYELGIRDPSGRCDELGAI